MPETVDPSTTAYAHLIGNPAFPSDGTIPDQTAQFQPRFGIAWDVRGNGRSVIRANAGLYYARQNMLSQVGSVTTNGLQQKSDFASTANRVAFGAPTPTWPNILPPSTVPPGTFPFFTGVRVFDREYKNPRIFTWNVAYEQELAAELVGLRGLHLGQGRAADALPELQRPRHGGGGHPAGHA